MSASSTASSESTAHKRHIAPSPAARRRRLPAARAGTQRHGWALLREPLSPCSCPCQKATDLLDAKVANNTSQERGPAADAPFSLPSI
eukprot:3291808-Pyramimonas_sp.AAC.1